MKKSIFPLLLALLLAACGRAAGPGETPPSGEAELSVLSFNIRYGTANDGDDAWPHREEQVYEVIRRRASDFVSLQEALRFQIDAIREAVPGYEEIGVGRDDGEHAGEYSAILYRTDRWRPSESGTFWYSDTPAIPGSTSWGNEITRIATWARFIDRTTGLAVWVFNTHFDHISQPSREKSAELLASRVASRQPQDAVIVTGDFNAGEDNPAIRYLKGEFGTSPVTLIDSFRVMHPDETAVGTGGGFEGRGDGPKIDYVFIEQGTRVRDAGIIRDSRDGHYPSDHFPVYAELALP